LFALCADGAIKDLQYELARVTKAHNDVIRVYESKLTEVSASRFDQPELCESATMTATSTPGAAARPASLSCQPAQPANQLMLACARSALFS